MSNWDYLLYLVHIVFWTAFGLTRRIVRTRQAAPTAGPTAAVPSTARFSRAVFAVHAVAFALMYTGIGSAVIPDRVPAWFPGHRIVGTVIIAMGAWLMCWSLVFFRSWRFRAKLDAGHELATGGPYAWVRHPIYAGLNLLALGTAVWAPTWFTWIAVVLMIIGSDLRGRAEEAVLTTAFGNQYRQYCARTKRFLPGVY